MFKSLRFLGLALLIALPVAAFADADVVTLTNGDHVTGTVRKLEHGNLDVGAEDGGSIEVPWKTVATITSKQRFEVELKSGQRFYGTITTPTAGHIEVKGTAGPSALDMKEVIRIT